MAALARSSRGRPGPRRRRRVGVGSARHELPGAITRRPAPVVSARWRHSGRGPGGAGARLGTKSRWRTSTNEAIEPIKATTAAMIKSSFNVEEKPTW